MRADVWVWSVRLYASRSAAGAACKGGQVHVNGRRAKPSQAVHVGRRLRKVADVAVTRLDPVLVPEEAAQRLRLRGRFDDDKRFSSHAVYATN